MPTTQGTFGELQAMVGGLTKKLDAIPIEQIAKELEGTLADARTLLKRLDADVAPAAKDVMGDASRTLRAAQATLATDAPLQADLRETLQELTRATASMRELLDYCSAIRKLHSRQTRGSEEMTAFEIRRAAK